MRIIAPIYNMVLSTSRDTYFFFTFSNPVFKFSSKRLRGVRYSEIPGKTIIVLSLCIVFLISIPTVAKTSNVHVQKFKPYSSHNYGSGVKIIYRI